MSKNKKYSRSSILFPLAGLAVFLFAIYTLSNKLTQQNSTNVNLKSNIAGITTGSMPKLYGLQFEQGYMVKGQPQPIKITNDIYTGAYAVDIPIGTIVFIGISTVGSGRVTVTDSRNNVYTMVKSQQIDGSAWVYLYASTLTTPLKPYDLISVETTLAKSIAATGVAYYGPTALFQASGQSGYNFSPAGPSVLTNVNDVVLVVTGFRAKSGDFGESYDPIVQALAGASSGAVGSSLDNSRVRVDSFISSSSGSVSIGIPLMNIKINKGVYWGSISASFH